MNQTNHFFNLGYGWLCKHCSAEDSEFKHHHTNDHRGAEARQLPLARWTDASRQALQCPRCGIEEFVSKA